MARSFTRKNKLSVISELNVTPLIDLAFSLLIIFMITTPVIEQYNRVNLPDQSSSAKQPPPPAEDKYITIDQAGDYFWGKIPISIQDLKDRLDQIAGGQGPSPTIHIRGDRSLPYQKVIDVVNLLKERNLTKLSLDTRAS
ncbi:MAG: biopolymer transporter ExbD [Opitutales bacterium]|nr:biopolymer transporter ExbD [Opitutales bacterium]